VIDDETAKLSRLASRLGSASLSSARAELASAIRRARLGDPEVPIRQLCRMWGEFDEAMDQWMGAHPDWVRVRDELAVDDALPAAHRERYRAMLLRQERRGWPSPKERQRRLERKDELYEGMLALEDEFGRALDLEGHRACYTMRARMLLERTQELADEGLTEYLAWRIGVLEHLAKQVESLSDRPPESGWR